MEYEYFIENITQWDNPQNRLDCLGAEGWELVCILPQQTGNLAYFKRKK